MTFGLKKAFLDWILNLDVNNGIKFAGFIKLFAQNKERGFLNFDYTNSLECKYRVTDNEIMYIHNKAESIKSNLILGHAVVDKRSNGWVWSGDLRSEEAEEYISDYYKRTCKSSSDVFKAYSDYFQSLNLVDEIFVLGHSISAVDILCFREIISKIHKKR